MVSLFLTVDYYRPQGKVMFSEVSVCPLGVGLCPGSMLRGSLCPGGVSGWGRSLAGGRSLSGGSSVGRGFLSRGGLWLGTGICPGGCLDRDPPKQPLQWLVRILPITLADQSGDRDTLSRSNFFNFTQFSGECGQNNRLMHLLWD